MIKNKSVTVWLFRAVIDNFSLKFITVDFEEVKTAPTECKEKCFQMSHLPIFTIRYLSNLY